MSYPTHKYDYSKFLGGGNPYIKHNSYLDKFLSDPYGNSHCLINAFAWSSSPKGYHFWNKAFEGQEPELTEAIEIISDACGISFNLDDIWE